MFGKCIVSSALKACAGLAGVHEFLMIGSVMMDQCFGNFLAIFKEVSLRCDIYHSFRGVRCKNMMIISREVIWKLKSTANDE